MLIKTAKKEDLESLNNLIADSKGYWGYSQDFIKKFMTKFAITSNYIDQGRTFIATQEKINIGLYSFSFDDDNNLQLDNFFINHKFIGQGKGRILWQESIKTANSYQKKEFILWSDPNAEGFYLKMGCTKIGHRKSPLMPNRYPAIMKYVIPKSI